MLALQYTNNRMMNWVACRSLPIHERYAGPQYFGHRLLKNRLDFIPSTFSSTGAPTVRPRSTSPGWLCCDVCEKWRRVDADSLRVWDNRFYFEGRVVEASRLLQNTDSGFHKRLTEAVLQRHIQKEEFNLSDLRAYASDEVDELEEQGAATFKFLSVVEFLRQSLPDRVQSLLGDDIFLHEATLWNKLVGPTFRCDLLVNTHCSDVADDAFFLSYCFLVRLYPS